MFYPCPAIANIYVTMRLERNKLLPIINCQSSIEYMKSFAYYALLLSFFSVAVCSCKNDITDMGSNIQPEGDQIKVVTDTFHLTTENLFVDRIYNRPDSLLLGTFVDGKYGTTYADILARFEASFDSVGFRYPKDAEADSTFLILSYRSWFGSENSVMSVKAYEMNKQTLDYYTYYPTNLDVEEYLDMKELLGDAVFSASDSTQSIRIRLKDDFTRRLFEASREFKDEDDFFNRFKGLYITSSLGDATMMYLRNVSMLLYYHYDTTIGERDTTFVNTTTYIVDGSVVNRFQHPDTARIRQHLEAHDSINYVASPANIYAQVNVPLRRIVEQMQDSIGLDKRLIVNGAIVRVEAKDVDNKTEQSNISVPVPGNMLLMKKDEMDRFFSDNSLPTDSVVYAGYTSADSCYNFNIARYITREIDKAQKDEEGHILIPDDLEQLELVLVPVRITTTTSSSNTTTISSVSQQVLINGVTIRSGNDPKRPMKIDLVYSGF